MPQYHHLMERLFNNPLLITQEYGQVITAALADRLNVEPPVARDTVQRYERPAYDVSINKETGVAIMPVVGAMVHRGGFMESMSGTQSYTDMQSTLMGLLDNRSVRGVLLDIDSGGGEAAGLPELANFIVDNNAIGDKPIWAIANTRAASAAYWLAASADRLYMAPGASVGSIGVYVQHTDMSKLLEKKGVVTSLVFAGKHKIDGNPFEPLPVEVRDSLQKRVDSLWLDFASYVADRRTMTVEEVQGTEAQMFGAREAIELRLADGEGTLGEVLQAFTNHLNRPLSLGYSTTGAAMTERALYTQTDLDRARTEGHTTGTREAQTTASQASAAGIAEARAAERTDILTALATVLPGDPRIETFCEAINDGTSPKAAAKFALRVSAPVVEAPAAPVVEAPAAPAVTRTAADVDALLTRHAPDVKGGEEQNAPMDAKAKRLAEISMGAKSFNHARGYAR